MALDVDTVPAEVPQPPVPGTKITRIVVEVGEQEHDTHIFINGQEVRGLSRFGFDIEAGRWPIVRYEQYVIAPMRLSMLDVEWIANGDMRLGASTAR